MRSLSVTVVGKDVEARIRQRLLGLGTVARQAVWQSGKQSVLIMADRVRARLLNGWLVVRVELQTAQTGRCPLDLVYFLGDPDERVGKTAAVRINAPSVQATQLAEIWGNDLQRVVWDAVLDVIELSIRNAQRGVEAEPLTVRGFHATREAIQVDVLTGAL